MNLRCETKAEPRPSFSWMVPGLYNISMYGPSWVSGIKWQHTLVIRGLTCPNSGDYKCLPKNAASERASSSVAIRVAGLFVIILLRYQRTISNNPRVAKFAVVFFRFIPKQLFLHLAFANFIIAFSLRLVG